MEGPIKSTVAQRLNLEMHGRAQGSSALAQLIVGGSIRPDVFIPITPGPMLTVLRAGKAETAQPIAHTEMVIAYNPKSRFAPKFEVNERQRKLVGSFAGAWPAFRADGSGHRSTRAQHYFCDDAGGEIV
jgi:ABC-type molybdate transport system substrate-binding protein